MIAHGLGLVLLADPRSRGSRPPGVTTRPRHRGIGVLAGHPARIRVLELLAEREQAVAELLGEVGIDPASLSQQLAVLRKANLVATRRAGSNVYYRLTSPDVVELLRVARGILSGLLQGQADLLADLRATSRKRPDLARLQRRPSPVVRVSPGASDTGDGRFPLFLAPALQARGQQAPTRHRARPHLVRTRAACTAVAAVNSTIMGARPVTPRHSGCPARSGPSPGGLSRPGPRCLCAGVQRAARSVRPAAR